MQRQRDPENGRRVVMSLTEAGEQAVRNKQSIRTEQLAQALAAEFSGAELDTLKSAAALIEQLGARF